jgi:hypothetical protein
MCALLLVVLLASSCSKGTELAPTGEGQAQFFSPAPSVEFPTSTPIPEQNTTETPIPTTVRLSTSTDTPTMTLTSTSTPSPVATLDPQQAEQALKAFLQKPFECETPCLLGIVPEKTTITETVKIFSHLGLQLKNMATIEGKDYFWSSYKFENGLKQSVEVIVQDSIVKNLRILINTEEYQEGAQRKWITYSPETLISQFGPPTKVTLGADFGPRPTYWMTFFYDALDLRISYEGYFTHAQEILQICPLIDYFDFIRIWVGKPDKRYPPSGFYTVEEATSITTNEFIDLLTGSPEQACVELKQDVFNNRR